MTLKEQIKALAADVGYHACGITSTEPFEDYRAALHRMAALHPESEGLYHRLERRAEPRSLNPWARSAVVCIRRYGKYALPAGLTDHIGRNYLCDRRIKECPDTTMPARMKQGLTALGLRVRTGGLPSRAAAVRAGVARIGRNGFAYADGCGSWMNIEAWMTNAELEPDTPAPTAARCPDGCRACMEVCRTRALAEPYSMRFTRCIAYLTYEAPFPITAELWSKMGPWIYGCDDCQRVCPLNRDQWEDGEPAPWIESVKQHLTPAALAAMDQETYQRVVYPLFGYIPETDLPRWHANATRALQAVGPLG